MKMRQKPVVAVVVGAILALSGGVAFAATLTSGGSSKLANQMPAAKWSSAAISVPPTTAGPAPATTTPSAPPATAAPTTAAPATAAPTTVAPAPAAPAPTAPAPAASDPAAPPSAAPAQPSVTYTVRPGDDLSTIAAWFKLHGYQALYQANMAVIGDNPNLIFPGQKITIADGGPPAL